MTLAPTRLKLFGEPQLLEGEDAAAYDELLARLRAAVKPVDIIEEMFIADVVALEWEVLRWRRLKVALIRARGFIEARRFDGASQCANAFVTDVSAGAFARPEKKPRRSGAEV
jgi:hypothetical protein